MNDLEVEAVIALGKNESRALKLETLKALFLIKHMASGDQRKRAGHALELFVASSDPLVAATARKLLKLDFNARLMLPLGLIP